MSKYIKDICFIFFGFYLFAVVLSAVESKSGNLIVVLNSLGGFISAGGAIAAILAVLQVARHRKIDSKYNSGLALIKQIESYLVDVQLCLISESGEPKNNRVEWIQAARAILASEELADKVQKTADKYELPELSIQLNAQLNRARLTLYKSLCVKEGNRSGSLPVSFFYGVEDWESSSFEQAKAEANSRNYVCYTHDETEVAPIWGSTELDERSVFVVGHFLLAGRPNQLLEKITDDQYSGIPAFAPYEGMAVYLRKRI